MNILITLCARGGSKGIPKKNVRMLNGYPLIYYSIKAARSFSRAYDCDIALSTDDSEIKAIAANYGIGTDYTRPQNLAGDTAGKVDVIREILLWEERRGSKRYDFVLDLDVTSPLRTTEDLLTAFTIIQRDPKALNLFSVNPAHRNPYFNMVEDRPDGYCSLVKKGTFLTRQAAPDVYDMNASFYFYTRAFFELGLNSVITDYSLIYKMPHVCFDLDHPIDFDFMEYLLKNDKLGFQL
jgi:CMP-N,N'-diacetyllegionaminic acid synthase